MIRRRPGQIIPVSLPRFWCILPVRLYRQNLAHGPHFGILRCLWADISTWNLLLKEFHFYNIWMYVVPALYMGRTDR